MAILSKFIFLVTAANLDVGWACRT